MITGAAGSSFDQSAASPVFLEDPYRFAQCKRRLPIPRARDRSKFAHASLVVFVRSHRQSSRARLFCIPIACGEIFPGRDYGITAKPWRCALLLISALAVKNALRDRQGFFLNALEMLFGAQAFSVD